MREIRNLLAGGLGVEGWDSAQSEVIKIE